MLFLEQSDDLMWRTSFSLMQKESVQRIPTGIAILAATPAPQYRPVQLAARPRICNAHVGVRRNLLEEHKHEHRFPVKAVTMSVISALLFGAVHSLQQTIAPGPHSLAIGRFDVSGIGGGDAAYSVSAPQQNAVAARCAQQEVSRHIAALRRNNCPCSSHVRSATG